ncbi:MAG: hypothetical protein JWQ01_4753 [Massilia sp.]|nr:hypothetical protein [Massilia sp.]
MTTILGNTKLEQTRGKEPYATSTTTPPRDTFCEVAVPAGEGVLMYWPEKNGFIALFPEEFRCFSAEADDHSKKVEKLQLANQKVSESALRLRDAHKRGVFAEIASAEAVLQQAISDMHRASADVKKALEPLGRLDAKEGAKMVELVSLHRRKEQQQAVPLYVKSTTLRTVLAENRVYLLSGEKEKSPDEKVYKDGKLNTDAIKKKIAAKVQDKAGFSKKWKLKPDDAEAYTGVLGEWAKTMNGDVARFLERSTSDFESRFNDPKDPHRNIDLSAEAQLMRYTAGAGLEINFKPFKGNLFDKYDANWQKRLLRGAKSGEFGIKANAQASFAIAEGCIRTSLYYPHYAGWHATAEIGTQRFELGYWRFLGDITLSGGVGASLAVEVDVEINYTRGKQEIRGIASDDKDKAWKKVRNGVSAEFDAFAGARTGVDVKGALQWLNPEGAPSNGKPTKVKPIEAVAEFKDVAKVSQGAAVLGGIGLKGAYQIAHEKGRFVIYVKMGACLGVGLAASLKFEVGAETIGEFFKCIAYQLKRADYHKMADTFQSTAYVAYCQVKYLVVAGGRNLEEFAATRRENIRLEYSRVSEEIDSAIKSGAREAEDFVKRIRHELEAQTSGWLSYAPPEVLGKIHLQVASLRAGASVALQAQASELTALALGAPQTPNQLETIAEHMTEQMGDKQDHQIGLALIASCLKGTLNENMLAEAQSRLVKARPLMSRPFIWNSEPEFVVAKLAIEQAMYS